MDCNGVTGLTIRTSTHVSRDIHRSPNCSESGRASCRVTPTSLRVRPETAKASSSARREFDVLMWGSQSELQPRPTAENRRRLHTNPTSCCGQAHASQGETQRKEEHEASPGFVQLVPACPPRALSCNATRGGLAHEFASVYPKRSYCQSVHQPIVMEELGKRFSKRMANIWKAPQKWNTELINLVSPSKGAEDKAASRGEPGAACGRQRGQGELSQVEPSIKHQDAGMYKGSAYSGYPFLMLSDPYLPNGSMSPLSNKVPVVQPSHGVHPLTPLIPYSNDHFSHGSHSPHFPADINQKQGVHRPSQTSDIPGFYPLPPGGVGQITPSMGWEEIRHGSNCPGENPQGSCSRRMPASLAVRGGEEEEEEEEEEGAAFLRLSLPRLGARCQLLPGRSGMRGSSSPNAGCSPQAPRMGRPGDAPCKPILNHSETEAEAFDTELGFKETYLTSSSSPVGNAATSSCSQKAASLAKPTPLALPRTLCGELRKLESWKPQPEPKREKEAKKPTIKKPLNAFMLYMKEMRAKVIAECTLKESAAINQILGRRWHALSREEQAKYYELARKERQLHMQLYPGWSARDNYGKKKRRTREKQQDSNSDPASPKKCRARFGLNQQTDWCGPCRRKKKCIRYLQGEGRCASPVSSDGSAIDSPPSPLDALQCRSSAFPSDKLATPAPPIPRTENKPTLSPALFTSKPLPAPPD
nr:PREDICTED: transcription factor 7 [Struthio camelus australis]